MNMFCTHSSASWSRRREIEAHRPIFVATDVCLIKRKQITHQRNESGNSTLVIAPSKNEVTIDREKFDQWEPNEIFPCSTYRESSNDGLKCWATEQDGNLVRRRPFLAQRGISRHFCTVCSSSACRSQPEHQQNMRNSKLEKSNCYLPTTIGFGFTPPSEMLTQ